MDQGQQRRRFSRIYLDPSTTVADAQVVWANQARTFVVDLSYRGAAFAKPQGGVNLSGEIHAEIDLKRDGVIKIKGKVVWENADLVGVEFVEIPGDGPRVLEKFLTNKLVGSHLFEISPTLYKEQLDCQFWYHGPGDVDVQIWTVNPADPVGSGLQKAEIHIGDDLVLVKDTGISVHHFGDKPWSQVQEGQLVKRCAELMSQLKSKNKAAEQLFMQLDKNVKKP